MGNRVQRVRTEVSTPQMSQAITEAWSQLFGEAPSKEQVAMVLAQNSLETGHRKSMWNYNIGNITTSEKSNYDYFDDLPTNEQINPGVWKKMYLKYRAYPSLRDGVKDYLKLLKNKRYTKAWEHIVNPDPVAFSKALKSAGYYTANEAPYTKTLTKLYNQFSKSNIKPESLDKVPLGKPSQQYVSNDNSSLTKVLDNYLQMVAASEKGSKKFYKKMLPTNNVVIKIASNNYTNSIEFSRVLCTALEEELMATAYTHTDGNNIEIECSIMGPSQDCFNAVQQLSDSLSNAFIVATNKIGGIKVNAKCVSHDKSSYDQIDYKVAESQHRKFILKFI